MVAHLNHGNVFFQNYFRGLLRPSGTSSGLATSHALAQLDQLINSQAGTIAFVNAFWVMGVVVCCLVPLPFLMKKPTAADVKATEGLH